MVAMLQCSVVIKRETVGSSHSSWEQMLDLELRITEAHNKSGNYFDCEMISQTDSNDSLCLANVLKIKDVQLPIMQNIWEDETGELMAFLTEK